ncbi:hypothetical protein GGR58DRAFT_519395 [Xylaria digitata]|nr:hypothetical protein GGR58DRAFT_519395 [Xylaria digitata]
MPLAPAVSSQARGIIQLAFQSLEKTISPADSRKFASTNLQDVRAAAIKLEEQLSARRCLRNMRRLEPLFNGLGHYANAVGVLCNGTPFLPWVWAPITLILNVASEYVEAFEKVIDAYSRIAESLKRFEFLNSAYASDKDFQQTLAVFYSDILQFHEQAYKFLTRNGWKLLFLTSWGRFQRRFDDILENLKRHESLVDKEANARNISEERQMRQEIRDWRRENIDRIEQLEKDEAGKRYHSIASWLKVDDSGQQQIYDSLHSEGQSYPGTCTWSLKNKSVQLFLQKKPVPQVLWLRGVAGSGKSVLSAELINFAELAGCNTIRFFCSRSYRSNTYDQIVKSLFLQILRKDSELIAYVYRESVLAKASPSSTAIERLFHRALMTLLKPASRDDYIWVFIDGINECDPQTETRIIELINLMVSNLTRSNGITCKVLVSSRASDIISKKLRKKDELSLTEEKSSLSQAIKQYTSQRLQELHVKLEQLSLTREEIEGIEQSITRKSDGMFLYARLILDYLANNIFIRSTQIKSAVNDLPEKLSDFYKQILSQILAHLNPQSVELVRSMLGWVAFARRPLKRVEFLSAMAFSEGDYSITTVAPGFILEVCNTLVEERADTTLSFIHNSVQEFLESPASVLRITETSAVEEQGIATIACLLSGLHTFSQPQHQRDTNIQVAKGLHALHIYATEYWTQYLLCSVESAKPNSPPPKLIDLASDLSKRLDERAIPAQDEMVKKLSLLDPKLQLLGDYPLIQKQASVAIYARSLKNLQERSNQLALASETTYARSGPAEQGLEALLSSYQETIIFLLEQEEYPGVSPKELEEFKLNFRTSKYTCRFASCPRATLGFESKKALIEHETGHLRQWACPVVGCQYPPFGSAKSLQAHSRIHHDNKPQQRPIRKAPIPNAQIPNDQWAAKTSGERAGVPGNEELGKLTYDQVESELTTARDAEFDAFQKNMEIIIDRKGRLQQQLDQEKEQMNTIRNADAHTISNRVSGNTWAPAEEKPCTIKCICHFNDDDGNTIYCERCDTWQHIECYFPDSMAEVQRNDFHHSCVECNPRILDRKGAFTRQIWKRSVRNPSEVLGRRTIKSPPPKSQLKKASQGAPIKNDAQLPEYPPEYERKARGIQQGIPYSSGQRSPQVNEANRSPQPDLQSMAAQESATPGSVALGKADTENVRRAVMPVSEELRVFIRDQIESETSSRCSWISPDTRAGNVVGLIRLALPTSSIKTFEMATNLERYLFNSHNDDNYRKEIAKILMQPDWPQRYEQDLERNFSKQSRSDPKTSPKPAAASSQPPQSNPPQQDIFYPSSQPTPQVKEADQSPQRDSQSIAPTPLERDAKADGQATTTYDKQLLNFIKNEIDMYHPRPGTWQRITPSGLRFGNVIALMEAGLPLSSMDSHAGRWLQYERNEYQNALSLGDYRIAITNKIASRKAQLQRHLDQEKEGAQETDQSQPRDPQSMAPTPRGRL